MNNSHVCYMEDGSIINGIHGGIIEHPALVVSASTDVLHVWGDMENVKVRFDKVAAGYRKMGWERHLDDLKLIELSQYKIDRETACYVLRRAAEFTGTGFITTLCQKLEDGSDVLSWLESEKTRIPIDIYEKNWK